MEILQIALLGGLLALDATSVGQFMVSRPLVSGALAGWLVGEPVLGMSIGATLELYLLVAFPTGGSRFPEGAVATVVAVGSSASGGATGAVPVAIAMGLVWGQLGGLSITWLRRANGRLAPESDEGMVSAGRLARAHILGVLLDFLRGTLVTATGVWIGRLAVSGLGFTWPFGESASGGLLLVGAAVSVGILLRDFGGYRRHRVFLAAGLALGILGTRFL
jgi:PTS system mannose-specific IIC component